MDFLNGLMIKAALRGLIVAGSGVVVGRGIATDDEYQAAIAGITGLITLGYQIYSRSTNKQIKDTAKLEPVAQVVKRSGEVVR